mgnify:CR=1 FL=1
MLSSDEMRNMMKLKNKKKDSNAQAKFYKWYNGLSLDDKSQFDKHCKKTTWMGLAIICIAFCLVGSCMFGGNKNTTDNTSNAKQGTAPSTQNEQKTEGANLFTIQNHIQDFYKSSAQAYGTGYPEVDCSFASHYRNEVGGLTYMKGEYTLSIDKSTHTYNARYGAGSEELLYLILDGQKVFWNEEREDYYKNLDFKKSQPNKDGK